MGKINGEKILLGIVAVHIDHYFTVQSWYTLYFSSRCILHSMELACKMVHALRYTNCITLTICTHYLICIIPSLNVLQ